MNDEHLPYDLTAERAVLGALLIDDSKIKKVREILTHEDFYEKKNPMKVLIMVSKFDHCLLNLLYRHHKGELDFHITAIVSNHLDLRAIAEREGIRFIYLPVTKETKLCVKYRFLTIGVYPKWNGYFFF